MSANIFNKSHILFQLSAVFIIVSTLLLSGCSTAYNGYGTSNRQARSLPAIPEIPRPVTRRPTAEVKPANKPRRYQAQVKKYSVDKPAEPVITQKEVSAVLTKEKLIQKAQKEATVDIDPYASVPENAGTKGGFITSTIETPTGNNTQSSTAVKTLILKGRAELAIGNSKAAISHFERGLRIEAQNPKLWHLLAQANYGQSNYQQSIAMAKKSIRYSGNSDLVAKNWALIKKAGERSGDTVVVKEALNYFKLNP